jgi:hypothetical protein
MVNITVAQQQTLTQEQLNHYKSQFLNDRKIQALTLEELIKNTNGGKVDWSNLPISTDEVDNQFSVVARASTSMAMMAVETSDCQVAIGYVIFDAICLAVGGVGLRASASRATAESIAEAARPVLSQLEAIIATMAAEGASLTDIAQGVFAILKIIWSRGCLGAVLSAFLDSLTWYYAILYGATAMATIVAAVATDGVAFVAEVVIELATFGFLIADSVNAVKACN